MVLPLRAGRQRAATGHRVGGWPSHAGWEHRHARWLAELGELLAFPTVSAQPAHRRDIAAAARWLADHLRGMGMHHAEVLPGPRGGHPSVYADWLAAPNQPTVLLYGHFDVQPVEPLSAWRTPPFQATLIGDALHARGASDDKGQLFIHLKALETYLSTTGRLPVNVKVWLEGEEEINSPNLQTFLDREAGRLRADAVLVSDTEMLGRDRPSIIYGLRGNLTCRLEVRGPAQDLHSGRYGGAVLNPLQALCDLVAGLHDRQGRVAVAGFYRRVRVPTPREIAELQAHGAPGVAHLTALDGSVAWGEAGYTSVERVTTRPALTVNALRGGYTGPGGASTSVIPSRAEARLSLRLVPDQDPLEIARLLHRHIAASTPAAVRSNLVVTGATRSVLIPRRHPAMAAAARAVCRTWGLGPAFTRSGGSIAAVEALHRRLGVPVVLLGFGLPDDGIHAPNEKISLSSLFRGIGTVAAFLREYAR